MSEWTKGFWAMIAVCVTWGLSPIFYRALAGVPTVEVLAHRTIWSLALFLVVLGAQGRLGQLRAALTGAVVRRIALAALTISANWGLFIWAVQAGHVVQSSLGYYIFPLAAVMTGVLVFGESLTRVQAMAILLAVLAVVLLTWGLGVAPWISLGIALTFVLYGALKKSLPLGPVLSVAAEVALLAPLALGWLIAQALGLMPAPLAQPLGFGANLPVTLLLIASGAITAVPLILFSYAARRIEMATVGLMFYLNPTLQFLCAVLLFGETFTTWHMIAFAMIWAALAVYSASALRQSRRAPPLANG
ncbi:EamA family transporter RarD [Paracoccus denitrificans]|jgi:chloramphenicol-sensitive protein RarD|uniref:RarD protein, DMT superfamily transporter n=1 Tax=Paracoccus denitrificans (strain Pd 1222) TaxID=318586 RepID=A1B4R7_PARDP|nr:EamA family transporter RarD [Paracoccus denitrificans]ABL70511.1 RarD protein, DMT superfamily transporter [Paracoccus denitrificans PD1222]MBB4627395.1 chloramphenicol-sensitive protein RarD [Paracoccus denitrificans]MCU7431185.1 EamA family transporter RarD [Paracoccus denitrificans]QAR25849.1 EamA family transporter RarD [Paracoccus denitrificans]UPV94753.1 EamA family transporter RarD [Paracoccus denitrificans]